MSDLVVNENFDPKAEYGSAQRAVHDAQSMGVVRREVTGWPGYEPTPLIRLDGRAAASGVGALWCKQEGARFGIGSFKPTGPTYAMLTVLKGEVRKATGAEVTTQDLIDGKHEAVTREVTISAATSGNHGRALAWGAGLFGCRCIIYMNDGVSAGREAVIAGFGAEVVRVPGSFDQAVLRSFEDAEANGYFVICDRQRRYPEVPLQIIQGYAMVGDEITQQLSSQEPPTHVFIPGGSGKLASAVCGRLWEYYRSQGPGDAEHPRVITVEPEASACLQESARQGRAAAIDGAATTVLDGLVVGTACEAAWTILGTGAFAYMTVEDQVAIDAMRQAASGQEPDPGVVIGDTGSAGWAGFLAATRDEGLREQIGLNTDSRVVIVVTEGATDPEVYRELVGMDPDEVD